MLMNDLFEIFAFCSDARIGKEVDPKERDGLVIFVWLTGGGRDFTQRVTHLTSRLANCGRFSQIHPGHMQMQSVMEILVRDPAPFESAREFDISHALLPWSELH